MKEINHNTVSLHDFSFKDLILQYTLVADGMHLVRRVHLRLKQIQSASQNLHKTSSKFDQSKYGDCNS